MTVGPKFVGSCHMPEECIPGDIMVKHWDYWQEWHMLQPLPKYGKVSMWTPEIMAIVEVGNWK